MPWFKTRTVGDDDVVFVLKKRIWWTFWLASTYEDYSTARAAVNKIDTEIIELIHKIEAKLSSRMVLAEACEAEYKQAAENKYDFTGVSKAYYIDDKQWNDRVKPYIQRPDEKIMFNFLNPVMIRKFQLNKKFNTGNGQSIDYRKAGQHTMVGTGSGSGSVTVIPEEYRKHAIHFNSEDTQSDQIVFAKDEEKGKGSNPEGKKAQMAKLRGENPYQESVYGDHKEWNKQLEALWQEKFSGTQDR